MHINEKNNSKLKWIVVIGVIVALFAVGGFYWQNYFVEDDSQENQESVAVEVKPTVDDARIEVQPIEEVAASVANIELINDTILQDKITEQISLVKEELAKLEDIQKQLNDQQTSLKSQHEDADQLIHLKEEQIKLLEKQLKS